MAATGNMTFRRYGRSLHLVIETAEDLQHATELDEAHWVATTAPVETIRCDETFLHLVDCDSDGRILVCDIKKAICWACDVLRDRNGLAERRETLRLSAVNDEDDGGRKIKASAEEILQKLGRAGAEEITLAEVRYRKTEAEAAPVSEAGVVLPAATDDTQIRQFIADIVTTIGGAPHPSGQGGVGQAQLDQFRAEAGSYLDWCDHGQVPESQPETPVAALGAEKLRTYLDDFDEKFGSPVQSLIADGGRTATELSGIRLVEKLILYQAHLMDLANNFVSFPHLYEPHQRAMFEMGCLVMDGRRFNFAVKVDNREQHARVAATGNMFVLYVSVTPRTGEPAYEVAVPVASGGKGNLCVNKRGVFQDLAGRECDAQIVYIIENPISIGEAIVSPFTRLGRLLTGKIESLTAAAEKKLDTTISATPPPAKASGGMLAGGLLIGGGVAIAALGSALAYITKTLSGMDSWKIFIGIGAVVLAVMLPTAIVAFLKLRKRDLSAILEGSGWGINARMWLTRKQSRYFTQRPGYPKGAKGTRGKFCILVLIAIILGAAVAIVAGLLRGRL